MPSENIHLSSKSFVDDEHKDLFTLVLKRSVTELLAINEKLEDPEISLDTLVKAFVKTVQCDPSDPLLTPCTMNRLVSTAITIKQLGYESMSEFPEVTGLCIEQPLTNKDGAKFIEGGHEEWNKFTNTEVFNLCKNLHKSRTLMYKGNFPMWLMTASEYLRTRGLTRSLKVEAGRFQMAINPNLPPHAESDLVLNLLYITFPTRGPPEYKEQWNFCRDKALTLLLADGFKFPNLFKAVEIVASTSIRGIFT